MASLKAAWRIENMHRAWRWIRSNPDRAYKGHFRELYSAYPTADDALLKQLRGRLERCIFEPSDACKLFLPKPRPDRVSVDGQCGRRTPASAPQGSLQQTVFGQPSAFAPVWVIRLISCRSLSEDTEFVSVLCTAGLAGVAPRLMLSRGHPALIPHASGPLGPARCACHKAVVGVGWLAVAFTISRCSRCQGLRAPCALASCRPSLNL